MAAVFGVGAGFGAPLSRCCSSTRHPSEPDRSQRRGGISRRHLRSALDAAAGAPLRHPAFLLAASASTSFSSWPMKPLDALCTWFALACCWASPARPLHRRRGLDQPAGRRCEPRPHRRRLHGELSGGIPRWAAVAGAHRHRGWRPSLSPPAFRRSRRCRCSASASFAGGLGREPPRARSRFPQARPPCVLAAGSTAFESTTLALLPIWGVRTGLAPRRAAAALLTALGLGSVALQLPIGVLSDRMARLGVLRLCALAGLAGAALLPLAARAGNLAIFAAVPLWGGCRRRNLSRHAGDRRSALPRRRAGERQCRAHRRLWAGFAARPQPRRRRHGPLEPRRAAGGPGAALRHLCRADHWLAPRRFLGSRHGSRRHRRARRLGDRGRPRRRLGDGAGRRVLPPRARGGPAGGTRHGVGGHAAPHP